MKAAQLTLWLSTVGPLADMELHACNPQHQCGAEAAYHRFLDQDCFELLVTKGARCACHTETLRRSRAARQMLQHQSIP